MISGNEITLKSGKILIVKIMVTEKDTHRLFAGTSLFNLAFRPFFLGAALYGVIIMLIWWLQYSGLLSSVMLTPAWHAHEMIFGYALAVIVGFLLTSVRTWTGLDTASGAGLFVLFCLWAMARVANTLGYYQIAAGCDLAFMLTFGWCAVYPIVKVKQWRQTAIVGIIIALFIANCLYYAGQLGIVSYGIFLGNTLGFYTLVGLILVMAGRVVPFFTERGVAESVNLPKRVWLEVSNLIIYAIFVLMTLVGSDSDMAREITSGSALLLFVLNAARLSSWFTRGIWQKPLLWSLFLSYGFITLGFLLHALLYFGWFNIFIPIHCLAVGGIGLMTLSMMARVSLGHTGHSIHELPPLMVAAFSFISIATITRVLLPIVNPENYLFWIQTSQILWIISFVIFLLVYAPILVRPRIDNQPE